MTNVLLFLDFDGVLHPDAVYLTRRGVELRADGALFMWSPHLVEALEQQQNVRIVLSTSWARKLGFQRARAALPAELQARVIGATWHSAMGRGWPDFIAWDVQTRFEQIQAYLSRLEAPASWIAIDDDDRGWPHAERDHLIHTDPDVGLGKPETRAELARKLAKPISYDENLSRMTVLFLDIDGVLQPEPPQPDQRLRSLPRLVSVLRDFPQVDVVISSLWRETLNLEELRALFPLDLRDRIIGVTPIAERVDGWLPARREGEILDWLQASGRICAPWIALDDQGWQFTQHRDRLIECVFYDGLDDRVEAILRKRLEAGE